MSDTIAARPKPPKMFRWTVLIFISLAMFGNYFIYDSLAPAAESLIQELSFTQGQIGFMQGMYSVINIIMVLIGGILVDRIGAKVATFIFAVFCLIGAIITVAADSYMIMLLGRVVFALGAETLIVAVTTAIAIWFKGKELSFAFGINLLIARLGSWLAQTVSTWSKDLHGGWTGMATWLDNAIPLDLSFLIADPDSWKYIMLFGVTAGLVSVVGALVYWVMENEASKKYDLGQAEEAAEKINFKEIFKFNKSYWYIVALCITFYSAVFPFQTFGNVFFQHAHGATADAAGQLNGLPILMAMFMTPIFGFLADRYGKRSRYMFAASIMILPIYLMMGYLNLTPYIPMIMMGVAFSVIPAIMWPSVAYVVDKNRLGTAYGVMTMIQNVGMAGFNFILGGANDISKAGAANPGGYNPMMWILTILGFFGLAFAYLLWKAETGPDAHGLETITTKSTAAAEAEAEAKAKAKA
jgi:MFS family permease